MKIGAIIQSRMSSRRLPGKALRRVEGKPILQYLLEGLRRCRQVDEIVVCTSSDPSDDALADFCKSQKTNCYRGSLENVAGRYKGALEHYQFDGFVRVNGDSPLFDFRLIDRAVTILRDGDFEVVTNALEPNRPKGQGVEVLRTDTFLRTVPLLQTAEELEHVTSYIYENHHEFRFHHFSMEEDDRDVRLNVDTEEDLAVFAAMVARMDRPHWDYPLNELVEIYRAVAPATVGC